MTITARKLLLFALLAGVLGTGGGALRVCRADAAPASAPAGGPTRTPFRIELLTSPDPAVRQQALVDFKAWYATDKRQASDAFLYRVNQILFQTKNYDAIAEIVELVTPAKVEDPSAVSALANLRIRALFLGGRLDEGLKELYQRLQLAPLETAGIIPQEPLLSLMAAGRSQEVLDLSTKAILLRTDQHDGVANALRCRIRVLTDLGKTQEALADTKRLYNICSMNVTAEVLTTLAQQLDLAYPDTPALRRRFWAEQRAGASPRPAAATPETASTSVLASIHLDPEPYLQAAQRLRDEDYRTLVQRGNLLLLADHPQEAQKFFVRAYALARPDDVRRATENIARQMKAADGTVGRANAWVLSLRPTGK